ncbi:MAG: uroporphyrinogen decarboxylase family protein [Opitutaceae bacterium]|jgi:MtaA/CmuA family methyltransferase
MNHLERCLAVLAGETPDQIPVVPQTFMFAAETAGIKVGELARCASKMVEAQVVSQARYGYDGCVIDFDDASLAEACGARVIFRTEEPAIVDEAEPVVKTWSDIDKLKLPDPWLDGRLPVWLEATRLLADRIGDQVWRMGRADQGPLSLACLLRGAEQFMLDLMDEENHPHIDRLIDYCRRAGVLFAKAQLQAGAHATSIGDSFAGPSLVSPELFRRFALEPEIKFTQEVQVTGRPFSIHICGNTNRIIGDMGRTGARILEVDWQLDMAEARRALPVSTILMGNINPSDPLVLGSPAQVTAAVRRVVAATGGRGLFLSSGCALGRNTKPENLEAMIAATRHHREVSPDTAHPRQP